MVSLGDCLHSNECSLVIHLPFYYFIVACCLVPDKVSLYYVDTETSSWLVILVLCVALSLIPLWWYISHYNEHTNDVLYTGWTPIIGAMVISR